MRNKNQRYAMKIAGLSSSRLAAILDTHPVHLSFVFDGRYESPELREKIAKVLNCDVRFLWPEGEDKEATAKADRRE